MWKTTLNRSIRELRFVVKQSPSHFGVWNFVHNKLPEIRLLNQNTNFSITEITENYTATDSSVHVVYGDVDLTVDEIATENLSSKDFEKILKEKIEFGLTLKRRVPANNDDRDLPLDIVEARNTVSYIDDEF